MNSNKQLVAQKEIPFDLAECAGGARVWLALNFKTLLEDVLRNVDKGVEGDFVIRIEFRQKNPIFVPTDG